MPYSNMLSAFKGQPVRWYLPIVTSIVIFGITTAWISMPGPPPESSAFEMLWLSIIFIIPSYIFGMLLYLVLRVDKRSYDIAVKDLVQSIVYVSTITLISIWLVVVILKSLLGDLRPSSEEYDVVDWVILILCAFTVLFCFGFLVGMWGIVLIVVLTLGGPEAADGDISESNNHQEVEEV
ncbi:hypothetical protein BCON_0214g00210 [Botryotinia convoluta]|uniref:Uncharacterized protein n=1 Tax=Botryotinia convoluta TaxID=54673 RepID=A0A4Z1HKF4_9HELO|nr:hypothetical protein BCON_0214g00210 [Botryotinia convoluta]